MSRGSKSFLSFPSPKNVGLCGMRLVGLDRQRCPDGEKWISLRTGGSVSPQFVPVSPRRDVQAQPLPSTPRRGCNIPNPSRCSSGCCWSLLGPGAASPPWGVPDSPALCPEGGWVEEGSQQLFGLHLLITGAWCVAASSEPGGKMLPGDAIQLLFGAMPGRPPELALRTKCNLLARFGEVSARGKMRWSISCALRCVHLPTSLTSVFAASGGIW